MGACGSTQGDATEEAAARRAASGVIAVGQAFVGALAEYAPPDAGSAAKFHRGGAAGNRHRCSLQEKPLDAINVLFVFVFWITRQTGFDP